MILSLRVDDQYGVIDPDGHNQIQLRYLPVEYGLPGFVNRGTDDLTWRVSSLHEERPTKKQADINNSSNFIVKVFETFRL